MRLILLKNPILWKIETIAWECNCSGVGQTGGLPWSLDILQTKREPIPKGLHLSAQGCARRATLGV